MLRTRKQTKEEKLLGVDTCSELESMDAEALEVVIVQSSANIKQAKEELDANEKYQSIKSDLLLINSGFHEVRKRQNAMIQYALKLREAKGK